MFKKALAILLSVLLIVSSMPITALANMENTKNNTAEENQQILEAISPITNESTTKEDMLKQLQDLGLLNGEGELVITPNIDIDGESMTLEEIRVMLEGEEVDLDKQVSVDGTSLTIGNLKTMLEIEDEIARIRSEYLDPDVEITEEHEDALASLMDQLRSEGLTFNADDDTEVVDLSGVYRDVTVTLSTQVNGSNATVTATLDKEQTEDVTFHYRTLNGSYSESVNVEDTVTIPKGETSQDFEIPFASSSDNWWGDRVFYVQCYDVTNALFDNDKYKETLTIGIEGSYDYPSIYEEASKISILEECNNSKDLEQDSNNPFLFKTEGTWFNDNLELNDYFNLSNIPEIKKLVSDGIMTHLSSLEMIYDDEGDDDFELDLQIVADDIKYPLHGLDINTGDIKLSDIYSKYNTSGIKNITSFEVKLYAKNENNYINGGDKILFKSDPSGQLCFKDATKPTVTSVDFDDKTYEVGDEIPIIVTFSEPVKSNSLQLMINGLEEPLKAQEADDSSDDSYSDKLSFLYTVTKPIAEIEVKEISGAKDLGGNEMDLYSPSASLDIEDITDINKMDAFSGYNIDIDDNVATIEIPLNTDNEEACSWVIAEAQENENAGIISSFSAKVIGVVDEDSVPYDVVFKIDSISEPTKLVGEFTIPYNFTDNTIKYTPAFYLDKEIGSSDNKELIYDMDKDYDVIPTVFLEDGDFSIKEENWPEDLTKDIYLEEIGALDLGIDVTNIDATWQSNDDFLWESSDESVATIDNDGKIVFTGKNGQVYFTLTALNGNLEGKQLTIKTETMSVKAGLTPFLTIPKGADTITVTKGKSAQLRWSSNIVQKKIDAGEATETNFDISIYEADYSDGDEVTKGKLVHNDTAQLSASKQTTSYNIPAHVMSDISKIGKVSYVVEIRARVGSEDNSEIIKATGYIEVKSSPAVVTLEPLDNLFITDKVDNIEINYSIDNFDDVNDSKFLFKITKNEEEAPIIESKEITEIAGSYNLTIEDVDDSNLKDIYTVTVMAKNELEPTWSYDSYVLYVYNEDAIKIMVDGGAAPESIILDNNPKISAMSSDDILDLKREISLDRNISINDDEYEWAQLGDMITWDTAGSSATVNYNNFGTYFNIDSLGYTGYSPSTDFILSGLKEGDTRVRATHGLSKMSDSLNITVNTLKDKLYLFQAFPKIETELTYYIGNEKKTATTNSNGAIAIYEENGISSDVYFKSTYNGEVYLGTFYNNNLKTKEQDASRNKLYPLNIAELRPVTRPSVVLNTKDGKEFNGTVILRGGVYKNGEYCENALINNNDGKKDQTVMVKDGILEVNLDTTQFWISDEAENLNATDDIEFVFELQFSNGDYYPEIIKIDGNVDNNKVVQNGENNVILTSTDAGDGESPYIYKNSILFENGSELKIDKDASKVGPNKNFPNIELVSTVLCLDGEIGANGEIAGDYTSEIVDQFKDEINGQSYSTMKYPFSSFPILIHKLKLNKNTLWMDDRLSRSISIKVNKDGDQIAKLPYHFNIVNLINVDITEDGKVMGLPDKMLSDIIDSNEKDFQMHDKVITTVLEGVSKVEGLDTSVVKMMLKPTADPAVFDTIIKINVGYGDIGGIDDREETGAYVTGPTEDAGEFSLGVDGAIDTRDFINGDYKDGFEGDGKTKRMTSVSPAFEGGGYITGKIRYNFDNGEWEMFTTSSSFNVAAGVNVQILINSMLGPVPVTAEFDTNGSVSFAYSMASHSGTTIERLYDKEFVNDYLKELRFDLYVKAFGGVGVDYSIVALKVGVFGEQDVSLTQRWLYRGYIKDDNLFGREVRAEGRVGIEFKAKVGFVDYTKVLASAGYSAAKGYYDWDEIDDYWKDHKNGTMQNDPIDSVVSYNTFNNRGMDMEVAYETVTLEGRDYLDHYDREWNGPAKGSIAMGRPLYVASSDDVGIRSVDDPNEVNELQTNSYPYSNPKFTDDGQLLVYLSDMGSSDVEKTKVCYSKRSDNSYEEGSEVYEDDEDNLTYGDSYLNVAGDGDFAVATWVTQTESIKKDAGMELTNEDIALMTNSTEVMASIYSGNSWSTPTKLSDNKNADLAPVVATNGDEILVAWRSAYAQDAENPIEFGGNDKIVYKTYDGNEWSDTKVLYNGTLGNIMGIEVAMLEDGTSSVVYTVEKTVGAGDPDAKQNNNNLEVLYSVIDEHGDIVQSVRATNDDYIDENPKITTHGFEDRTERFVIGWYSIHDSSDIRLCAYNNEGAIYNGFIDSISQALGSSEVNISSKFQFSKSKADDDISIVWVEPMKSDKNEALADKDGLYGLKIRNKDKNFYATSPNQLAVMDDYTLIDHFDARTTGEGNIKAVILATDYNSGEMKSYPAEGGSISVKEGVSELLTATGVFDNSIRIDSVYYDLESVRPGMEIPIQFEVYNSGIDEITDVGININLGEDDEVTKSFNLDYPNSPIVSGGSKTFTVYYTVPQNIENVDYTVTASYQDDKLNSVSENGKLYMVFPDVGISKIDIVKESQGLRDIVFSLYNASGIKLDDSKHRVVVEFYDNANFEGDPLEFYDSEEKLRDSVTITDYDDIEKINKGTYSSGMKFELEDLIEDLKTERREIPSGGITIYGYAKIEETDEDVTLPEIKESNNKKSVTFESLIEKQNNEKVTILTKQSIENDKTIVDVTVQNNSLAETTDGNLIVSIKNGAGEVVEQKQSYDVDKENKGLIELGYEEKATQSFVFDNVAESSEIVYSEAILDSDNADLGSLSFKGLEFYFDQKVDEYTINSDKPISTTMEFTTANPDATAKVNGAALTDNKMDINLNRGSRQITIEVTSADKNVTKEYLINIGIKAKSNSNSSNSSSSSKKKHSKNDEKVVVNLADDKSIPIDFFKQLEEGNGKNLVLDGGFYTIEFDSGQKLKDVNAKNINFGLSLESPNEKEIDELVKSDDALNLYFTHHGELPAKAKVKVDIGRSYKGKELYLYYYNEETNKLENYGLVKVESNGKVEFEIDHFSDYVLYEKLVLSDGLLVENIDNISYVSGYSDGTFKPDGNITRAEVAKLFDNILRDIDVNSNEFTDCDMWAKDSILQLSSLGFVNGYSDNTFKPNNDITRAEFVKLITNILEVKEIQSFKQIEFNDIGNSWAKKEIETCSKLGIVNGYGESFKPNNNITRAEAVTIINRLIGRDTTSSTGNSSFSDVPESHWAYPQIINAVK